MCSDVVSTRSGTFADEAVIADIARRAYAKYVVRIGREPAPMAADFREQFERGEVTVATDGVTVRGFVVAYARAADYFIENIAVDPAFAGHGIGGYLMARADADARAVRRSAVRLYTNARMFENFGFYERLGFRKTHDVVEDGFHRIYFEKGLDGT